MKISQKPVKPWVVRSVFQGLSEFIAVVQSPGAADQLFENTVGGIFSGHKNQRESEVAIASADAGVNSLTE